MKRAEPTHLPAPRGTWGSGPARSSLSSGAGRWLEANKQVAVRRLALTSSGLWTGRPLEPGESWKLCSCSGARMNMSRRQIFRPPSALFGPIIRSSWAQWEPGRGDDWIESTQSYYQAETINLRAQPSGLSSPVGAWRRPPPVPTDPSLSLASSSRSRAPSS